MDVDPRTDPPDWWDWPLAFTPHIESRMEEGQFSEVDLRTMLADTTRVTSTRRPGRFLARSPYRARPWAIRP